MQNIYACEILARRHPLRRRCREENIRFIGPSPESIEMMGDKISARKKMIAAGVKLKR